MHGEFSLGMEYSGCFRLFEGSGCRLKILLAGFAA